MADKNIEHIAEEYANAHFLDDVDALVNKPWHEAKELYAKTLVNFAVYALSNHWISVDERLPENENYVLAHVPQEIQPAHNEVAYWDNEDWHTQDGEHIRPDFWLLIPPLNPEKEER